MLVRADGAISKFLAPRIAVDELNIVVYARPSLMNSWPPTPMTYSGCVLNIQEATSIWCEPSSPASPAEYSRKIIQ